MISKCISSFAPQGNYMHNILALLALYARTHVVHAKEVDILQGISHPKTPWTLP